ncbi:uvrABC system protein C [Arthrobacter sp. Hiyo8]|nr:uvrABC system protein C [Arthrobacter sp. Hiyo8]
MRRPALAELGIDDVYVVGLAKRLEEVWLPDSDFPVILPRTSQGLYLLQRIRDEAHRFAITFHRQKRGKAMTVSALDGVPGLGEAKRKALVAHFGSLKKIKAATASSSRPRRGSARHWRKRSSAISRRPVPPERPLLP